MSTVGALSDPHRNTDVLVVGAGPVGLTAACVLARGGVRVEVCERDAGPIDQSRALLVQPRTLEHFAGLGIADEALAAGQQVRRVEVHVEGRPRGALFYVGVGRSRFPRGLVLEQSKTQRLLLQRLAQLGEQPHWSSVLESLDQDLDGVTARLRSADGAPVTVRARYVIGADGASSTVRRQVGGSLDGHTYAASFFLADTVLDTTLDHERLYLSVTRTHFHALFPMPGPGRWRVIGSLLPDEVLRYVGAGETIGATRALGRADVERLIAVTGLPVAVREVGWATGYRIHQRMVARYRYGRVFLAGDAAHIHSPAGGQGMNTGIGDAVNLAWKLAEVVRGRARPELLETYHAERAPVAREVLRQADQLFRLEAGQSRLAGAVRVRLLPLLAAALSGTATARRLLFDRLSQIAVSYREPGRRPRRVRGATVGDRLPYVTLDDGSTSHDLLAPDRYTLLVAPAAIDALDGPEVAGWWRDALAGVPAPVRLHVLYGPQRALRAALAHDRRLAVLVRPDGHIAELTDAADTARITDALSPPAAMATPRGARHPIPTH